MAKILVAEDDLSLLDTVCEYLRSEHHVVESVSNGDEALALLKLFEYDVIILDWALPGMSGLDVCANYRRHGGAARAIMLTGKREIEQKEAGFAAGVDDYVTKPFEMKELAMRVRALMRRSLTASDDTLRAANLVVNAKEHHVLKDGEPVQLAPKEFALLEFLLRHPNQVFSNEALLSHVWHSEVGAGVETVKTCVYRLRSKLDLNHENLALRNVHGVGYKLDVKLISAAEAERSGSSPE